MRLTEKNWCLINSYLYNYNQTQFLLLTTKTYQVIFYCYIGA